MAGRAEVAHGSDKASRIQKFDGLPEKGKVIDDGFRRNVSRVGAPVLGEFVSTLGAKAGVDINSNFASDILDQSKPKFTAKITILDAHSDEAF